MTSSTVTVSHGSDFFGCDTVPAKVMRELGEYVRGIIPAADQAPLTRLLETAGETEQRIDSGQAALLAVLLRRTAASKRLQMKYAEVAARLGVAAANSAADAEPWTWTINAEETCS
ncbi:DUF7739 domain-containing protein [Streptomyces sp. NPDC001118]